MTIFKSRMRGKMHRTSLIGEKSSLNLTTFVSQSRISTIADRTSCLAEKRSLTLTTLYKGCFWGIVAVGGAVWVGAVEFHDFGGRANVRGGKTNYTVTCFKVENRRTNRHYMRGKNRFSFAKAGGQPSVSSSLDFHKTKSLRLIVFFGDYWSSNLPERLLDFGLSKSAQSRPKVGAPTNQRRESTRSQKIEH